MKFEIWGALNQAAIILPQRPIAGIVLIGIYLLAFILIANRWRDELNQSRQDWLIVAVLSGAAFLLSQFLAFSFAGNNQFLLRTTAEQSVEGAPFGFVPILAAGLYLNPMLALIVGFFGGLSRAIWQTHSIFTPLFFALAGWLTGWLVRQNYQQNWFQWLRRPIIAAPFALVSVMLAPIGWAAFAYAPPQATWLEALDQAFSVARAFLLPLLIEGVVAGAFMTLLLLGEPRLGRAQDRPPELSPQERSLKWRIASSFALFASALITLLLLAAYTLSLRVATDLVANEMGRNAQVVSERIPEFIDTRLNILTQFSRSSTFKNGDVDAQQEALRDLFRTGAFFRRAMLVDDQGDVLAAYPERDAPDKLANEEIAALEKALESGAPANSNALFSPKDDFSLTFIAPILGGEDDGPAAVVGRVPDVALRDLNSPLQSQFGVGQGFLVDDAGQIIAHPDSDSLLSLWSLPATIGRRYDTDFSGFAYESRDGVTNAREIVYFLPDEISSWGIVTETPYEVALGIALNIAAPLLIAIAVASLLFVAYLLYLGNAIVAPINQLGRASKAIAEGSLDTAIMVDGEDEIGRLATNFQTMQRSLKERVGDLSLLLSVSKGVSSSIDVNQGIPPILQGALRATGASAARIVIINPLEKTPIAFGEGPASQRMASYDRDAMNVSKHGEAVCLQPDKVAQALELQNGEEPPVPAAVILPLHGAHRFQGVFWIGFRGARNVDRRALDLLHTLASQAAVLIENWTFFITTNSQRRRLKAVLASATNAVIVTDSSDKVLLINPAMEQAFDIVGNNVVNLPITQILKDSPLLPAMLERSEKSHRMEVVGKDEITWLAEVSPINHIDGKFAGRVAVLHDITSLVELDKLRTEFVETVAHDLRTPLTFVRSYASMLPEEGKLNDIQMDQLSKILRGIDQMVELVQDVLDLERIEAGDLLSFGQINLLNLLRGVTEDFAQPASDAGVPLRLALPATLPKTQGDYPLLRQAVGNLINNAIKYAPNSGEIIISATLQIESEPGAVDKAIICVKDQGRGIPPEKMPYLFDKFYRAKERGTERIKGSGLGLTIVRSVVERHGGSVWCESKVGEGSAFFIALPVTE